MEIGSGWEVVREQFETILLYLQRPIVWKQFAAFLVVVLLAWLFTTILWQLVGKRILAWAEDRLSKRTKYGPYVVVFIRESRFPLLVILGLYLLINAFSDHELLVLCTFLFWIILLYRLIIASLYIMLGERMKGYHSRFIAPMFYLFLMGLVLSSLIDLGALGQIELWTLFENPIVLGNVLMSILFLYFLFTAAWVIQDVIKHILLPRRNADPGMVHAGLTIGSYLVMGLGILVVLDTLGLDASSLTFISGGLSVGIGFGLQKILANFISGIILLFERSLSPGDVISIEGDLGIVDTLHIRSTTIRTLNNVQVIVPNETFLTNAVTNYTHKNRIVRMLIPVGASYDSDPREIFQALLDAAQRYEGILNEPAPTIFFSGFGDNSIDFNLAVWIDKPIDIEKISSELRLLIWDEFAKRNIEMPFPQRDLHIRSGIPWEQFGAVVS